MPLVDGFDVTTILSINPLGIAAGAYDSLQIADAIDAALPKIRHHYLDHSRVHRTLSLKLGQISSSLAAVISLNAKELDARGGIRTHELLRERILSPPVLARLAYPRFPKIVHMVFEEEMY